MEDGNEDRRSWCCSLCNVSYELNEPNYSSAEFSRCYCGLRHWCLNNGSLIRVGTSDADLEKHLLGKRGGE